MLSLLSAAWWVAKAGAVKDGIGRFFNGASLKAVALAAAVTVAILAVVIGGTMLYRAGGSSAVAAWQSKLSLSRLAASLKQQRLQRQAEEAAAAERALLVERLREASDHAVSLERELAAIRDNPICYPATITEELRK
jgi:hypothetical protein